ncbi:MAG: hypothetical protein WC733_00010 [Methylophilus sp.]|jgi:hypothetical protein
MMLTNVSDTSIDCYHSHKVEFNHQEQIIMDFIDQHKAKTFTRREIAFGTGLEVSAVAGRVNALIHEKGVLHELPRRKCTISGISSHTVMRKPVGKPEQVDMFNGLAE